MLDCFTHMGTFALNCGYAGASDVLGLDISEFAVEQARENAKLNHLEKTVHFKEASYVSFALKPGGLQRYVEAMVEFN